MRRGGEQVPRGPVAGRGVRLAALLVVLFLGGVIVGVSAQEFAGSWRARVMSQVTPQVTPQVAPTPAAGAGEQDIAGADLTGLPQPIVTGGPEDVRPNTPSAAPESRNPDATPSVPTRAASKSRAFTAVNAKAAQRYLVAWTALQKATKTERGRRQKLAEARLALAVARAGQPGSAGSTSELRSRYAALSKSAGSAVSALPEAQRSALAAVLAGAPATVTEGIDAIPGLAAGVRTKVLAFVRAKMDWSAGTSAARAQEARMTAAQVAVTSLQDRCAHAIAKRRAARARLDAVLRVEHPQRRIKPRGCPLASLPGTVPLRVDVSRLCGEAITKAATPQAAGAARWVLSRLGAPYACGGAGRMDDFRFDCSSLVSRAYAEGAGLETAGESWAPSTRNMLPWGGVGLDPHYAPVGAANLAPGDIVLYRTCISEPCAYQHVVMYLGTLDGVAWMIHTHECGGVAAVEPFWGTGPEHNFAGARRVMPLEGERIVAS